MYWLSLYSKDNGRDIQDLKMDFKVKNNRTFRIAQYLMKWIDEVVFLNFHHTLFYALIVFRD